jgi:hypothetical protein
LSRSAAAAFGAQAAPWAVDVDGVSVNVMTPKYILGRDIVDWNAGHRRRSAAVSLGWHSPPQTVSPAAGAAQQAVFREHRTSEEVREQLQPQVTPAASPDKGGLGSSPPPDPTAVDNVDIDAMNCPQWLKEGLRNSENPETLGTSLQPVGGGSENGADAAGKLPGLSGRRRPRTRRRRWGASWFLREPPCRSRTLGRERTSEG